MRTSNPIQRLTAATFRDAANSSLFFLVRVEGRFPTIHRGIVEFFQAQYGDMFGFGTLPLKETQRHGWWDFHFRTSVGPVRGEHTGYFLFLEGEVVGTHPGRVRQSVRFSDAGNESDPARAQAEADFIHQVAFGGRRVSPKDLTIAVELITYFDQIVSDRQGRKGFRDGAQQQTGGTSTQIAKQTIAIPGETGNPFKVLKVSEEATDEEIRAAYKLQMKLNHPDKVSHMSPEIQEYAQAWTKVIRQAYEALKKK